jgi:hypothetical protein
VEGRKVTSKINGNSIFLPAAGRRDATSIFNSGSDGFYWSSSVDGGYSSHAYSLHFHSDGYGWHNTVRYGGFTVRPVSE